MLIALIIAAQTEPLSGGAGWVGAGLLGGVLAWLMFWHLPAKDKQISDIIKTKDEQLKEVMAAQELEREKDRTERHDRASSFQKVLNDTYIQHSQDAEKDRGAFMQRSSDLGTVMKMAIEKQTLELQRTISTAVATSCNYRNGASAPATGAIKENV